MISISSARFLVATPTSTSKFNNLSRSSAQGELHARIKNQRFFSNDAKPRFAPGIKAEETSRMLSPRPTALRIETGSPDNVRQIVSFYGQLGDTDFEQRFHGPKAETGFDEAMTANVNSANQMLSFDGDKLIGVAEVGFISDHLCDLGIVVDSHARGHGVGKELVLCAKEFARSKGMQVMVATTKGGAHNPAVVKLMQACGFQAVNCKDPSGATDNVRWEAKLTGDTNPNPQEL
jgi:RimJ/RimL family protein N-acetyltransferase